MCGVVLCCDWSLLDCWLTNVGHISVYGFKIYFNRVCSIFVHLRKLKKNKMFLFPLQPFLQPHQKANSTLSLPVFISLFSLLSSFPLPSLLFLYSYSMPLCPFFSFSPFALFCLFDVISSCLLHPPFTTYLFHVLLDLSTSYLFSLFISHVLFSPPFFSFPFSLLPFPLYLVDSTFPLWLN